MRVARAITEMQAGKSITAATRIAHTTPEAVRAETTPASLPVRHGRVNAASSSRVRLDLGRAQVLTTEGVMPARLRTLRDWELWQAQDRLINLVSERRPVPAELVRKLRGAKIDGLLLVSSPEVVDELAARGALDVVETLSPTLADDDEGGW
jgi:hypothetical protein